MPSDTTGDMRALKLLAEELHVGKRDVTTGIVTVSTVTTQHEAVIDEWLAREQVEIERVEIMRYVDAMPAPREEGDTMILPVVEEVLVTERRLLLREEVRITRTRTRERHQERVALRRQEAVVGRAPAGADENSRYNDSHQNEEDNVK